MRAGLGWICQRVGDWISGELGAEEFGSVYCQRRGISLQTRYLRCQMPLNFLADIYLTNSSNPCKDIVHSCRSIYHAIHNNSPWVRGDGEYCDDDGDV